MGPWRSRGPWEWEHRQQSGAVCDLQGWCLHSWRSPGLQVHLPWNTSTLGSSTLWASLGQRMQKREGQLDVPLGLLAFPFTEKEVLDGVGR